MLAKIAIAVVLLLIVGSLVAAAVFMLRDTSDSDRMARALTWRIGLSVAAFVLLMLAGWAGLIEPNGVR